MEEKKSLLQQALEPFIMGAQHSISAVRGSIEDKGILPTMGSIFMEGARGASFNPIVAPAQKVDIARGVYEKLPQVTPWSSFIEHPSVQQRGGDLVQAIGSLLKRRYGTLPD